MKQLAALGFLVSLMAFAGCARAAGTPVTLSAHGTPVFCTNCGFSVGSDGTPLISKSAALLNGLSLTFFPPSTGQGAALLQGTNADTLSLLTNDGGVSHLRVGDITLGITTDHPALLSSDGNGNLITSASLTVSGNSTVTGQIDVDGQIVAHDNIDVPAGKAVVLGSGNPAYLVGDGSGNATMAGGFTMSGRITASSLTGSDQAYACLDASGNLLRSETPCK